MTAAAPLAPIPIPPVAWSRAGLSACVPRATLADCNVFELARLARIDATTDAGRAFCEAARVALVDLEARMGVDDRPRTADGDVLYPAPAATVPAAGRV